MQFIKLDTKMDSLGRVVIPIGVRRKLGIGPDSRLDIVVNDEEIVLRKTEHTCTLCGSDKDLIESDSKYVCKKCLEAFTQKKEQE